jgi:hypothetical protein
MSWWIGAFLDLFACWPANKRDWMESGIFVLKGGATLKLDDHRCLMTEDECHENQKESQKGGLWIDACINTSPKPCLE